ARPRRNRPYNRPATGPGCGGRYQPQLAQPHRHLRGDGRAGGVAVRRRGAAGAAARRGRAVCRQPAQHLLRGTADRGVGDVPAATDGDGRGEPGARVPGVGAGADEEGVAGWGVAFGSLMTITAYKRLTGVLSVFLVLLVILSGWLVWDG